MAETHVLSALVKKRSEVEGEIEYFDKQLKEYRKNMTSLDKTIHIFDTVYNIGSIKNDMLLVKMMCHSLVLLMFFFKYYIEIDYKN